MKRPSLTRRRQMERKRAKAAVAPPKPLSRTNLPTGFTMSVDDLAELADMGRNQAYEAVQARIYPAIRTERGAYRVLVEPTLQILRGEREPGPLPIPALGIGHNGGPPLDDEPPKLRPRMQAKPKRRVPRKRNPKPAAKKGEAERTVSP